MYSKQGGIIYPFLLMFLLIFSCLFFFLSYFLFFSSGKLAYGSSQEHTVMFGLVNMTLLFACFLSLLSERTEEYKDQGIIVT